LKEGAILSLIDEPYGDGTVRFNLEESYALSSNELHGAEIAPENLRITSRVAPAFWYTPRLHRVVGVI